MSRRWPYTVVLLSLDGAEPDGKVVRSARHSDGWGVHQRPDPPQILIPKAAPGERFSIGLGRPRQGWPAPTGVEVLGTRT